MQESLSLIEKLYQTHSLLREEYIFLIKNRTQETTLALREKADYVRRAIYGNNIFVRGLTVIRFTKPNILLPATTALGTVLPNGRELGILSGANVVMPNLSPVSVRKKYSLYNNKICTGEESAQCRGCLDRRIQKIGFTAVIDRGDAKKI